MNALALGTSVRASRPRNRLIACLKAIQAFQAPPWDEALTGSLFLLLLLLCGALLGHFGAVSWPDRGVPIRRGSVVLRRLLVATLMLLELVGCCLFNVVYSSQGSLRSDEGCRWWSVNWVWTMFQVA